MHLPECLDRLLTTENITLKQRQHYFIIYTAIFAIMALLVFSTFWIWDITFIWVQDGVWQHVKALTFYSQWLRGIVRTLLQGTLNIPEFNFSLGMGSDILQTLHYYVIGDPLNLLSIFCPTNFIPYLYTGLILLRLYWGGIVFSLFCMHHNHRNRYALLSGSMVYVFCGLALYAIRHPFFINPYYQLPLILLGIDYVIINRKPYLFIFSVALAACTNFYFFYVYVLIAVIYVCGRLVALYRSAYKKLLSQLFKISLYSFIGVLLSAIVFIPVVTAFLSDNRVNSAVHVDILYPLNYYQDIFKSFSSAANADNWTILSFSVISLLAVFMLFRQRKSNRLLKVFFIIGSLCLLIPFAGHIFNGGSYVTNRWAFAYALLIAYIFVTEWPQLCTLTHRDLKYILICLITYSVICLIIDLDESWIELFIHLTIGAFTVCLLLFEVNKESPRTQNILLACTAISIVMISIGRYSPFVGNYASSFLTVDQYESTVNEAPDETIQSITELNADPAVTRYSGNTGSWNNPLYYQTYGTESYWSLSNPNVAQYRREINSRENILYWYKGFDALTIPTTLASVKYYVVSAYESELPPYGYDAVDWAYPYTIYKNNFTLPLGYTYRTWTSYEAYTQLSSVEKQQAQLQNIFLESAGKNYPTAKLELTNQTVSYDIVRGDNSGATIYENTIHVTEPNASLTLKFSGLPNSETIISISNLQFTGTTAYRMYQDSSAVDSTSSYSQDAFEKLSPLEQYLIKQQDLLWIEPDKLIILFNYAYESAAYQKKLEYFTPDYTFYNNRHDFDVNLGYTENGITQVTLTFSDIGTYTFDDLSVYCLPMTNYEEQIEALREDTLENVVFQNDTLTGTISLQEPKILCLSIPYSSGWSATVDGEPAELKQANTMYMALELTEGDHQIELHYEAPFLRLGAAISGFTLLGIVISLIIPVIRCRKPKSA